MPANHDSWPIRHHGEIVGHLAKRVGGGHFRLPASEQDLAIWSSPVWIPLLFRSRSWMFDPRPGDFKFAICEDELCIIASDRLGPGDLSLLEGFEAQAEAYQPDQFIEEVAAQAARDHGCDPMGQPL